jgi:hypothetical protein
MVYKLYSNLVLAGLAMVVTSPIIESRAMIANPTPVISAEEFKATMDYNMLSRDGLQFVSMNSDNGIRTGGDMVINELPPYNSLVQGMFKSDISSKDPNGVAFGVGRSLKINQYAQSPLRVNINSGNIKISDLGGLVIDNRDFYGNVGNTRVYKLNSTNYVNVVSNINQSLSTIQDPNYKSKVVDQYSKIRRDLGRMSNCQGLKILNPNSNGEVVIDANTLNISNSENNVTYIRLRGDASNLKKLSFAQLPLDNRTVIIETSSQSLMNNISGLNDTKAKNIIFNYTGDKLFLDEDRTFNGNLIANNVSIGTGAKVNGSITSKTTGIDPSKPLPTQESYTLVNKGIQNTLTCRQKPITKFPDLRVNLRASNGSDVQVRGFYEKAEFEIIVTNFSAESVKQIDVIDLISDECYKYIPELFVGESLSYKCSLPMSYVHYSDPVHKVSVRGVTYDTNKVVTGSDTSLVRVKKIFEEN